MLVKRKRNEIRKRTKNLTCGPRDVDNISWACFPSLQLPCHHSVILLLLIFIVFIIIPWLMRLVGGLCVVSLLSLFLVVASFLLSFHVIFVGWLPSRHHCHQ
jgi:hypothetical protein